MRRGAPRRSSRPAGRRALSAECRNNRRSSALKRSRCGSIPWIPTANPPIQSSPSGSMKSARHMFGRPSRFFTCWRRKGTRVQSLPARTSTSSPSRRQRHRPTVPCGVQPALGNDPVEHRLRILEQAAGAFADHRIVEDRRIIAGQLPGAEEGRPVDRCDLRSFSGHSPKWWRPGYCGGGALPDGS